ncbi:unnamed protein product [Arabidopsis thaliana]|uniref:(thale cress) hypothetical protein n=1 Tax=Arabidopsis thaliana TaxID=3702 RepID=A0A7G2F2G3_ARATH|nr:unnamed protein product [Arabidopsis thaliana]
MENGGTIPGQEIGSGLQKPVNPDGFVTIDVESFSNVIHKDFSSSSPRITLQRNVSRKGSPRSNNERKLHFDANACGMEIDVVQGQARRKRLAPWAPQNMQARPQPLPQLFQPRPFIKSPLLRLPRSQEI